MEAIHINFLAVLVSTIATFFLGFLWYTVLFGKAWAIELGMDMSVKPPASVMARGMILGLIGNIFLSFVLAHNIAAWGFVPGIHENSAVSNILQSAIFVWLGFYVPVDLNRVAWEKNSWKLFSINTFYHFLMVLVASTILTLM